MRRIVSIALLLGLSIILVISLACETTPKNTAQVLENDILIRLSTNKETYKPGKTVVVTASVENISSNPVVYTMACKGDPTPYVYLKNNPYFSSFYLEEKEWGGIRTVQPLVTLGQLDPYETVTRQVVWDQKFRDFQAPQGTYSIKGSIKLGDFRDESPLKTVSVELDIHIVGAPQWITQEQAKDIVLNLPEVSAWLEAHSGKNLVKEEDGNVFVLLDSGWYKASPTFDFYESNKTVTLDELPDWVPEAHVDVLHEPWLIKIGTHLGTAPHRIEVWANPETGEIIDIQFYEKSGF